MNECFSCQKNAPITVKQNLQRHKEIYEATGNVYWFFKETENGQTKIANDKSFKKILPKIKKTKGSSWCHIAEFGNSVND